MSKRSKRKRPSTKKLGSIVANHQRRLPSELRRKFIVLERTKNQVVIKAPLLPVDPYALPSSLGLVLKRLKLYSAYSEWVTKDDLAECRFKLFTDNTDQIEDFARRRRAKAEAEYRRRQNEKRKRRKAA